MEPFPVIFGGAMLGLIAVIIGAALGVSGAFLFLIWLTVFSVTGVLMLRNP